MVIFVIRENKRKNKMEVKLDCGPCWNTQFVKVEKFDEHFLNNVLPYIKCTNCGRREKELPEGVEDPGYMGGDDKTFYAFTSHKGGWLTPKDLKKRFNYIWKPL